MQVGDLVKKTIGKYSESYGIIIKDFGRNNHHCHVIIDGKVIRTSKSYLEAICK